MLLQRPLSAASSVIDLHGVTCKLGDGRTLFEDVSLSLLANATVGIVGPNGAGKSTFLKLLAGRGADKMTDGRVSVKEGVRVTYLAQEPELDEAQDVRANVALGGGAAAPHAVHGKTLIRMLVPPKGTRRTRALGPQWAAAQSSGEAGGWAVILEAP